MPAALKLQFRVAEPGWSWSGAAAVEAPGEFLVKIRHRNRGETLLLQLDVAAASSGSSIVATLSGRQGGFAPYRLDNCSCETIHVQQAGCVEQEDVLQPYSSLPFAWDEPSAPHRVLLFLPGHRPLGEFALEQVGQSRLVPVPSSSRDNTLSHKSHHKRRALLISTYAEGPMRVLRVLDARSHLLQQPGAGGLSGLFSYYGARSAAAAAGGAVGVSSSSGFGLDGWGSQGSLAGPLSRSSSGMLTQQQQQQQQQVMSRSSSTASLVGKAAAGQQQQQHSAGSSSSSSSSSMQVTAAAAAGLPGRVAAGDKHQMLRKLAAYLLSPQQASTASSLLSPGPGSSSSSAVVNIPSPSIDIQVQLQGFGISLVSDTRELLYGCCRGWNARFSQDAVRRAVGFSIGSIRVENTLYGCQYPLLLASPMALALAHAEEGAWLTLGSFERAHTMVNTDALVQVLGRHYILEAYQELPKVLASLDIFGDPARLLQALGLGFWHLLTLPAHSARSSSNSATEAAAAAA
ncbi:hypothetical protein OEZ85_004885 [Tetradesmus obliquus]|uniref:Vacuolar protein sorting-associated protein 13 VPS13 adaptor binding domain-containing protein n=1 Tax=Tetradesmus obliquus TaxID=3088 RepID=A0ABY8UJE0_TETOB|nr:hypothetical protein OEZ85_004885 [Tetradesmus obliquus]